jgi:hypothetical protein
LLKYGKTAKFGLKRVFFAENPHLIESNDRESCLIKKLKYSGYAVTNFWNFCAQHGVYGILTDEMDGIFFPRFVKNPFLRIVLEMVRFFRGVSGMLFYFSN